MAQELVYDLLVHPFYSFGDLFWDASLEYQQFIKRYQKTLENARHMKQVWLTHVKEIAKNPDRGLILIRPDFEHFVSESKRDFAAFPPYYHAPNSLKTLIVKVGIGLFNELEGEALNRLGQERTVVLQSKGRTSDPKAFIEQLLASSLKNINVKNGRGTGMGEYYPVCVKDYSETFSRLTGQFVRRSRSKSLSYYSSNHYSANYSDIANRHKELRARAKNGSPTGKNSYFLRCFFNKTGSKNN